MIQNKDKDTFRTCGLRQDVSKMIIDAIVYNNEAHVIMSEEGLYVPDGGNGTEIGMLNFLADNDQSIYDLYQNRQRNCIVETNIPFSPERKRQVVAIRNEN
jgi:magnesium-transporting ATPase (P-type)